MDPLIKTTLDLSKYHNKTAYTHSFKYDRVNVNHVHNRLTARFYKCTRCDKLICFSKSDIDRFKEDKVVITWDMKSCQEIVMDEALD